MKKLGLEDLEAILAVATRRNFRAAAIDVALSPSVLSQRVSAIESRFGVGLFNRTTRSVSLTEVGAKFVAEVELGVSTIKHAVDMANDYRETPTGLLRINSSVGAARRILAPVLLAFAEINPDIFVDLVTEDRPIDIVAEGFDAGVRPSDAVPKDMIALRLEPEQSFSVVGTPGYFEGRTVPRVPHDLLQHRCIRARLPSGGIERWEFEQDGRRWTSRVSLLSTRPALCWKPRYPVRASHVLRTGGRKIWSGTAGLFAYSESSRRLLQGSASTTLAGVITLRR